MMSAGKVPGRVVKSLGIARRLPTVERIMREHAIDDEDGMTRLARVYAVLDTGSPDLGAEKVSPSAMLTIGDAYDS